MIEAVRAYLRLFENDLLPMDVRLRHLAASLDKLACAYHDTVDVEPGPDVKPRTHITKGAATRAFPNFGYYPWSDPLKDISEQPLLADAIDDLEDIRIEMSETDWLWENVGVADATWYFRFSYQSHWGRHLQGLRNYVHALLFEA